MEDAVPRRVTLTEQVKRALIGRIASGELKPGSRLESTRDLVKRLGVSHVTATAALRELNQEGWITAHVGRGSFVAPNPPFDQAPPPYAKPKTSEELFFLIESQRQDNSGSYHFEILHELQNLAEREGWTLRFGNQETLLDAAVAASSGVGVVCPYDYLKEARFNLPLVRYGMCAPAPGVNVVTPDNFGAGQLAGQLLLGKGHRRLVFATIFNEDGPGTSYRETCWGLREILPDVKTVRWDVQSEQGRQEVLGLLEQIRAKTSDAPTCLVVGNKSMATEIYTAALTMGIKVPDELSLLSFIERPGSVGYPISFFDFSRPRMAREIVALLRRATGQARGEGVRVMLPMTLHDLGSVKDLR